MPPDVVIIFSLICLALLAALVTLTVYRTRKYDQTMARLQKESDERMKAIEVEHERRLAEINATAPSSSVALDVIRNRALAAQNRAREGLRNQRVADIHRHVQTTMQRSLMGLVGQEMANVTSGQVDEMLERALQGGMFSSTTTTTTVSTPEEADLVQHLPPEEAFRILNLSREEFQAEFDKMRAENAKHSPEKEPEPPTFWDRLNREE